jgi:Family of unknown function (DUF5706)
MVALITWTGTPTPDPTGQEGDTMIHPQQQATEIPAGLVDAGAQAQDALRRADTKATTLLQFTSAALAGVIAMVVNGRLVELSAASVLLWLSLAPIFTAVTLLLFTILPKLNRDPVPGTWLYAAQVGPKTLLEAYDDTAPVAAAAEVCNNSRIARAKYRRVTLAGRLLYSGLALLVLSLLTAGIA